MNAEALERLTKRLHELTQPPAWSESTFGWATNVLTVVEAVCGHTDTRTTTLQRLIATTAGTHAVGSRAFVDWAHRSIVNAQIGRT